MRFVSPSGLYRECKKLVVTETEATCILVRGKSFPAAEQRQMFPRLQLCAAGEVEVVAHPEPDCCSAAPYYGRMDMAMRVEATHPKRGSLAGGTLLTISGAGFSEEEDKIVRSAQTYQCYDKMTVANISTDHEMVPCQILTSNFSTIICRTLMINANEADPHDYEFKGKYVYNGPDSRNGRVVVSVNDITATGCGEDPDSWVPPVYTAATPTIRHPAAGAPLPASCEAVETDGGAEVVDYRFHYREQSIDLAVGVVFEATAKRDIHLALSPINEATSKSLSMHQPMYEIVIGGWGNTQSAIRRSKFGSNEIREGPPFILAGYSPRMFWVRYAAGLVEVGRGCTVGVDTFMAFQD